MSSEMPIVNECPPVLVVLFNRPDLAARLFDAIREIRPKQLFIAADGPRPDRIGELSSCQEARAVFANVDWDCTVKTLFQETNLGCRRAVSSAISWFFDHVESGIILEDDCIPHPTFFPFCADLLEHYKDCEKVFCITGNNFQQGQVRGNSSYYFSIFNHCWGWATWRRCWAEFDHNLSSWPEFRSRGGLMAHLKNRRESQYWEKLLDQVYQGELDSWAFIWTYTCWRNGGVTATPNVNLVQNIGFDERATHTKQSNVSLDLSTRPLDFPLKHPYELTPCMDADNLVRKLIFGLEPLSAARWAYERSREAANTLGARKFKQMLMRFRKR